MSLKSYISDCSIKVMRACCGCNQVRWRLGGLQRATPQLYVLEKVPHAVLHKEGRFFLVCHICKVNSVWRRLESENVTMPTSGSGSGCWAHSAAQSESVCRQTSFVMPQVEREKKKITFAVLSISRWCFIRGTGDVLNYWCGAWIVHFNHKPVNLDFFFFF